MEQRQAVRISVQLRAQLLDDQEQEEHHLGRAKAGGSGEPQGQGWYDGASRDAGEVRGPGGPRRRLHSEPGLLCGCARTARETVHHHHGGGCGKAERRGPALALVEASDATRALSIDGQVDDLSRHGLFLRTTRTLPPGTAATVCLELPDHRVCLRAQVVRVERGSRSGIGMRFVSEQPSRRLLANYLMRCHASGARELA